VEQLGVERSRSLLEAAELVLYLVDGEAGLTGEDRAFIAANKAMRHRPFLTLWNKADIAGPPAEFPPGGCIAVSAKTGEGIAELTSGIAAAVMSQADAEAPADAQAASLGTARQKNLVEAAIAAIEEALSLANSEQPLDLIAPMLREAVNSLGEITGEVSTADILETMFSKFCVGK
jgi:tRNA modification GTPase